MIKDAIIDTSGQYRYLLTRIWEENKLPVVFIMLNPSTADASADDPTIKRCMGFAKDWGYGGIIVINVFAFRSTDPKELLKTKDPVGPGNLYYITQAFLRAKRESRLVIAAWGASGLKDNEPYEWIFSIAETTGVSIYCLGTTKDGNPRHPLYLKGDTKPELLPPKRC